MDDQIGYENVCIGLENTNKVADLIEEVNMPFQKPQLPTFPLPDGYKDNNEFLWHLIKQGWKDRGYDKLDKESQQIRKDRLDYEMSVIHSMGFDGYFLFVWDFIKAAENLGIEVGKGRGSAAGSLVCSCCHITDIDPIKYGLIFERFLNPERVGLPDIDTDVGNRDVIIDYLEEQGVDVITQNADACGIGAIQQCDEDGLINVGAVSDQTVEGESCFLSVIQDAKLGIEIAVEKAIAGELPAGANVMGADVGVISLSSYSGKYADKLTDEQKAQIEELWELSKTTDLATLVE